ncbi:hypothetical protein [Paraflavitalea pollutisoli]|uniref:hypothetical protein n=1 Tax=Paraflavitalea pollutisoli TaxID=3034143 RepID=UPI0023ED6F85|nr:hypothetical protein [Paraflavitalea sp. H1-2-19X]
MRTVLTTVLLLMGIAVVAQSPRIDRKALVQRHTIHVRKADSLASLSLGNGQFAFTADITGLQSFPEHYKGGVPLGTQSEWGWHSFPNTNQYRFEETLRPYQLEGRTIPYPVQFKEPGRNREAVDYFRVNPHRLQLGNIGLEILKANGQPVTIDDISNIDQQLDMWKGLLTSKFTVEGNPVTVYTSAAVGFDGIAVLIESPLLQQKRLRLTMRFPYPNAQFKDAGVHYGQHDKHRSQLTAPAANPFYGKPVTIQRTLDTTNYYVQAIWQQPAAIQQSAAHQFVITPQRGNRFTATIAFAQRPAHSTLPAYASVAAGATASWLKFWSSGGAIDLAGSKDKRAPELERRIILSQYLTRLQCASNFPPQETGLTYNSWYGKPHLEMHWWHAVHFALWGRVELMEKSLDWYATVAEEAKAVARRQGFEGLRWQKMVDHAGNESPSSVGSFLIWQQPHFIYMAELSYREHKSNKVLEKYKDLVFATADFMASFPSLNDSTKKYNLGRGLIPAQECFDAVTTFNPTYELAYWHWALGVAQQWRQRLGLPRKAEWDRVMDNLAPLPQQKGVYLATESTPDCYTTERYLTDHPAVLGAYASIPASNHLDTVVMKSTFDLVWKSWKWDDTWGWDFPLTAMAATRLHLPEKAIDALFMPVRTNTYLINGHNFQDERLTIYLPGNGGLLSAIALMCAGSDANTTLNPGFPKDTWTVKWEGLRKMP